MNSKNIQPVTVGVIAVIVAAAAFFGGMQYEVFVAKNRAAANVPFQGQGGFQARGGGQGGRFGGPNGGGRTLGTIVSIDDKSMTVKLSDGSTKIVLLSDQTQYQQTTQGSKNEAKVGATVAAFGATNPDGSITAQSVQLNPQVGRMGAVQPSGSPATTPVASPTSAIK